MKRALIVGLASFFYLYQVPAHAGSILAVDNPAGHSSQNGGYADTQLFIGDDNLSVKEYLKGWHGDYTSHDGTNIGIASGRIEGGIQAGSVRLGYLKRADGLVQMGQQLADLVHIYDNHLNYQTGQSFAGSAQITGFVADGLHVSDSMEHAFKNGSRLTWGAGASLLRGQKVKQETVNGQVQVLGPKDFGFDAQMQDFHGKEADSGSGYALDAGVRFTFNNGARLDFAVNDLAARMFWKNVPVTNEVANSNTKSYDPNGYVIINPSFRGSRERQDFDMRLHPKWLLATDIPLGAFDLAGNISGTQGFYFPEAGLNYRLGHGWRLGVSYDTHFRTFGFSAGNNWLTLAAQAQNWSSLSQSRAYGLTGNVRLNF